MSQRDPETTATRRSKSDGAFARAYVVSMRIMADAIRGKGDRENALNHAMSVAMGIISHD